MFLKIAAIAALGAANCGAACNWMPINVYSADSSARVEQMLSESATGRQIQTEWRRLWQSNNPRSSTTTNPDGVGPAVPDR